MLLIAQADLLVSCQPRDQGGGNVYRHTLDGVPGSLDPAHAANIYSVTLVISIFDTLCQGSLGSDDYDRLSRLGQRQSLLLGERLQTKLDRPFCAWAGSLRRRCQTLDGLKLVGDDLIEPALNEYTVNALIRSAVDRAGSLGWQLPDSRAFSEPASYLATFLEWFPEVLSVCQRELNIYLYNASVTRLSPNTHGGWQTGPINCIDHLDRLDLQTLV